MDERAALLSALAAEPSIVFATLFGSRAAARARPDSDWDVGVFLGPALDARERLDVARRLSASLQPAVPVQVVVLNEAPPLLAHRALMGQRLSCRDETAWVRFFVRTLGLAEDERYWARIHERALWRRLREGTFGRP